MEIIDYTVKTEREMKIRDYLSARLGFSTSLIAKVKVGGVFLNGINVHMRATVKDGDRIEIHLPSEKSENIPPIEMPLDILFEDEWLLVISKPRNMPVHPSKGNSLPTLANGVMAYMGEDFVFRAVNRLDRDTSGIVIIAKNQLCAAKMSRQVRRGDLKKTYLAIVEGVTEEHGIIDAPIERECEGSIKRVVREDGKPSVTEYRLLRNMGECSLVKINLITGRTHQIRVHMSYIGHPLCGDFLYGNKNEKDTYRLHCAEISFSHPIKGELMTVKSKADFI